MRIALYTYNTKPRGGVVHTLALAEALRSRGCRITVYALGSGGESGFYRQTTAEIRIVPFVPKGDEPFEVRIVRYIDTYEKWLAEEPLEQFDIHHAQDCISANVLARLRERGRIPFFLRTVHHLDDFTTPVLVDCQLKSVICPDILVTVSDYWRHRLHAEYGRESAVIHNGVESRFFEPVGSKEQLKKAYGLAGHTVYLTLGGIEPRKNTIRTLRAFAVAKRAIPNATLVIAGGTTLFDYRHYLEEFQKELGAMDNDVRGSVRLEGTLDAKVISDYYSLADCYMQPSMKEGWGLAVMEAMAVGTPVVASTIEVFREFLTHEFNALLADPEDESSIAAGMVRIAAEPELRGRLSEKGKAFVRLYSWEAAADKHLSLYERMMAYGSVGAND
ncbi:MSMEG_0565 family glycosyltransferase [Paenibacillus oralis]|uniref:MSMEG_0565 family glycosyltransferase n=1 Tax=Paenibacillus oralis TaxID=2490856 RepID=A0A3P3UCC3_9BACL|nr:MSMEG_0565 family glycosyltransferase [Paenibacillus oralis]RRJ67278.1 MSMEG_0565 family glycosyltransferase [Paenibacillus oralis]